MTTWIIGWFREAVKILMKDKPHKRTPFPLFLIAKMGGRARNSSVIVPWAAAEAVSCNLSGWTWKPLPQLTTNYAAADLRLRLEWYRVKSKTTCPWPLTGKIPNNRPSSF